MLNILWTKELKDTSFKRRLQLFQSAYLTYDFSKSDIGGWRLFLRTPLFGINIQRAYPRDGYKYYTSEVSLMLWPNDYSEGGLLYKYTFRKVFSYHCKLK